MKLINRILIVFCLLGWIIPAGAQIRFFEGTYEEALQQAKKEKKDLFVDFWASWCGPCKMMATQVFTDKEVGEYFNAHFVSLQLDAEAAANKALVKRFQVNSLPTLLFISRVDKEMRRVTGARDAASFLEEAQIATGERLSYEQLYEKYKKNKKDFAVQQQLLIEAQMFMMGLDQYNMQKWGVRIDNLYSEYLKNKKLENMINPDDFFILTMYHPERTKDDPVFDFVVANYDRFMQAVDTLTVARYIVGMNNTYIIGLCKQGNAAYRESIKRVNGDLKPLYAGFNFGSFTVEQAITLLADATYHLYRHNLPAFFDNMDKYFAGKGKDVELSDYTQPLEDLAVAYEGNLPEEAYPRCIAWIGAALEMEASHTPETRTRLLVMMAQCFQHTDNATKAKQCYNQAFLESAQIGHPGERQQMQQAIQQGLETIGQ